MMRRGIVTTVAIYSSLLLSTATLIKTPNVECNQVIFDPSNLACDTCSLLLQESLLDSKYYEECLACCALPSSLHWKKRIAPNNKKPKYQMALFTYTVPSSTMSLETMYDSEISKFLSEDLNDKILLPWIQKKSLIVIPKKHQQEKDQGFAMDLETRMIMAQMGMDMPSLLPTPPTLYFYKSLLSKDVVTTKHYEITSEDKADEELLKLADETIVLAQGAWKREDLRDMIMTLLPS